MSNLNGVQFECRRCSFVKYYADENPPHKCPECGSKTYQLKFVKQEPKKEELINIDCTMQNRVRVSTSLGVAPNQIEAARKIHPGAEFTKDGDMIIHNRVEKKRRVKERGWQEYN